MESIKTADAPADESDTINDRPDVRTLALHVGEVCGVSFGDRYSINLSTAWNLSPTRQASSFAKLAIMLDEIQLVYPIRRVVYRSQIRRKRNGKSAPDLAADLTALAAKWAAAVGATFETATTADVMHRFGLTGNASGDALLEKCLRRGYVPSTVQQAHAIATFHYATQLHS